MKKNVSKWKFIVLLLLLGMNLSGAWAQETTDNVRVEQEVKQNWEQAQNRTDNSSYWTASIGGGANLLYAEGAFADGYNTAKAVSGLLAISGAYWFSPAYSLEAQFKTGILKDNGIRPVHQTNGVIYKSEDLRIRFTDLTVRIVTNVMNWGVEKRSDRPFSMLLHAGGGIAFSKPESFKPTNVMPIFNAGISANIKLAEQWSLVPCIQGNIAPDKFNNRVGESELEGYFELMINLSYKFK